MSGVNAHALLAGSPPVQAMASQPPVWHQKRHAILPAPRSMVESVAWMPAAKAATFACRLQSAHLSFLWGHASLPPAVPLELGLSALAMLADRPSACTLQDVVLTGAAAQLCLRQQAQPVLLASVDAATGQISILAGTASGLSAALQAAASAAVQLPAPLAAAATAPCKAWLPGLAPSAGASNISCTASLAPSQSAGSFCCHPAAQQAALDLNKLASGVSAGQLSAAACISAVPGQLPEGAAATSRDASLQAASGSAAVFEGILMRPADVQQPAVSAAADYLAYAVQLQVASTTPTGRICPPQGESAAVCCGMGLNLSCVCVPSMLLACCLLVSAFALTDKLHAF